MDQFIAKVFGFQPQAKRTSPSARPSPGRRTRPQLEALEGRLAPSTLSLSAGPVSPPTSHAIPAALSDDAAPNWIIHY
jgi:hypothetical protein